jgi:hypothetical protein
VTDESAARREPDQPPRQQRRGRKIAMGPPELDALLAGQRTCRVATASELRGVELRGVELRGRVETVGEAPRTGLPESQLDEPERLFARKYLGGDVMHHDGRHARLKLVPDKLTSWDFRMLFPAQKTTS